MRRAGIIRTWVGCLTSMTILTVASRADASGYASARFGGEHSTAADGLPTAIYYNPAALSLLDGQQLLIDASIALRTASYVRAPDAINASTLAAVERAGLERQGAIDALSGEGTLDNVILLPFVGVVSDLGMPANPFRVSAAFFVPFGGQSAWDEQAANDSFPGASDGSTRWYNIEGTISSLAGALGASYRIEAARLSFGLAGNLYFSTVNTLRARNANGTDNLVSGGGDIAEGRSLLDVSGVHFGLGAGVLWEPIGNALWVGASYQSQPGFGSMRLTGTLRNTLGSAQPAPPDDVLFMQELPDIVRLAVRARPWRAVELRVSGDWTRWSRLDAMCLANDAVGDPDAACATRNDGSLVDAASRADVIQIFQRRWDDGFGVRVGGSYFWDDALELYAGANFDSNAIPDSTLDPALYDMGKLTFTLGATFRMTANVMLSLSLLEVLYFERDTRGQEGNETFDAPSGQPSNAGLYKQNTFIIQPALLLSL